MAHVVLLGDSIFDNGAYIGSAPDVIRQLRQQLGEGWKASLLAVDGHVTQDVTLRQLPKVPADATHLVLSVGGNDALGRSAILSEPARSVGEAIERLVQAQTEFADAYRSMIDAVSATGLPVAVCTIYDTNYPEARKRLVMAALALFNDVITRLAFAKGIALIDLRLICDSPEDFANPIEPSARGGEKIASALRCFLLSEDSAGGWRVWTG